MSASAQKEPFKKVLSENVEVYYGWKDAHVVVKARLPIPFKPWFSKKVPVDLVKVFKQTFRGAADYGEGKSSLALIDPIQIEVQEDCKLRFGFKDRHLELSMKQLGIWMTLSFTFEEIKLGLKALDEASAWAELPQETRDLQGVTD
jgi:hypothetical protein